MFYFLHTHVGGLRKFEPVYKCAILYLFLNLWFFTRYRGKGVLG